eukprot:359345-Chlamydomonas_euryale.AAC.3
MGKNRQRFARCGALQHFVESSSRRTACAERARIRRRVVKRRTWRVASVETSCTCAEATLLRHAKPCTHMLAGKMLICRRARLWLGAFSGYCGSCRLTVNTCSCMADQAKQSRHATVRRAADISTATRCTHWHRCACRQDPDLRAAETDARRVRSYSYKDAPWSGRGFGEAGARYLADHKGGGRRRLPASVASRGARDVVALPPAVYTCSGTCVRRNDPVVQYLMRKRH